MLIKVANSSFYLLANNVSLSKTLTIAMFLYMRYTLTIVNLNLGLSTPLYYNPHVPKKF